MEEASLHLVFVILVEPVSQNKSWNPIETKINQKYFSFQRKKQRKLVLQPLLVL